MLGHLVILIISLVAAVHGAGPPFNLTDENSAPLEAVPYHASIEVFITKKTILFVCSGAVISPDVVLTTAHCVFEIEPDELRVRLGTLEREEQGVLYRVRDTMYHENYTWTLVEDNIGLVFIRKTFDLTVVKPIALYRPDEGEEFPRTESALLTGWGAVNHETRIRLWAVNVSTHRGSHCVSAYVQSPNRISCNDSYLHARWWERCFGDVGGLVVTHNNTLIGLTYYLSCDMNLIPDSVYIEVSNFYDWIAERVTNLV